MIPADRCDMTLCNTLFKVYEDGSSSFDFYAVNQNRRRRIAVVRNSFDDDSVDPTVNKQSAQKVGFQTISSDVHSGWFPKSHA